MSYHLSPVLRHSIQQTRHLLQQLDQDIRRFVKKTNLTCAEGCGHCCEYTDLEATLLEFLPLAAWAWDHGQAESLLQSLEQDPERRHCMLYQSGKEQGQGQCGLYAKRGMICRLFGFSARRDKDGRPRFVACSVMKKSIPHQLSDIQSRIDTGLPVPLYGIYQQKLVNIHPEWGQRMYPVNQAIRAALETVGYYREMGRRFLFFFHLPPLRK